jgi:hypothetical protein
MSGSYNCIIIIASYVKAQALPIQVYVRIQHKEAWSVGAGLIRRYWFQYKKIEVILAYLQIVHHVAVG